MDGTARYRAMILDDEDKPVSIVHLLVATDDEALNLAKAMVDGCAVELWDGMRYMERFDPER